MQKRFSVALSMFAVSFIGSISSAFAQSCPNLAGTFNLTQQTNPNGSTRDLTEESVIIEQNGCTQLKITAYERGQLGWTQTFAPDGTPTPFSQATENPVFVSYTFSGSGLLGVVTMNSGENQSSIGTVFYELDGSGNLQITYEMSDRSQSWVERSVRQR